jgi:hypothetical protein
VKAGLDEFEVKEWLVSDKGGKEVDAEAGAAHVNGDRITEWESTRFLVRKIRGPF